MSAPWNNGLPTRMEVGGVEYEIETDYRAILDICAAISDPELTAIQAYGVWQEKKNYGKVSMGVVRSTFVINGEGVIEKVMPKVKPDTNAAEILAYLEKRG